MTRKPLTLAGLLLGGLISQLSYADSFYNYYPEVQQTYDYYGDYNQFRWRSGNNLIEGYDSNPNYYQSGNAIRDGNSYINSLPPGIYRPTDGEVYRSQSQIGQYRFRDFTPSEYSVPRDERQPQNSPSGYNYNGQPRDKFRNDNVKPIFRPSPNGDYSPFRSDTDISGKVARYNQGYSTYSTENLYNSYQNYPTDDYYYPGTDYYPYKMEQENSDDVVRYNQRYPNQQMNDYYQSDMVNDMFPVFSQDY